MEIEVRTADQDKAALQAQLREYKSSLTRHKGELVRSPHPPPVLV